MLLLFFSPPIMIVIMKMLLYIYKPQSHNTKEREHVCLLVRRIIFSAIKPLPKTRPIDKREIGDAVIPGKCRIHTSPLAPPPPPTRAQ